MSACKPLPYHLDYGRFVISFEVVNYESFNFVLFEDYFDSYRSFDFHVYFRISLSISIKNEGGILTRLS